MKRLQEAIGYQFRDISLLENALAHSSYANERFHNSLCSNERLEFLGDSVLGMVVAEHLYRTCPDRLEGELSRMRADMVCEASLAAIAVKLNLGDHLLLGRGETISGGNKRASILADAVESVIAAIYLDGGFAPAKAFIHKFVLFATPEKTQNVDYKTALQELIQQKKGQVVTYTLVGESGPDHNKEFVVQACVNGSPVGQGAGSSKKRAEQNAAKNALEKLQ
ncbi:MAG: ribonuclease III [Oscillospiraceae bacterium]|nr:ribonuclease III [Oscillospiraceae bacterium]